MLNSAGQSLRYFTLRLVRLKFVLYLGSTYIDEHKTLSFGLFLLLMMMMVTTMTMTGETHQHTLCCFSTSTVAHALVDTKCMYVCHEISSVTNTNTPVITVLSMQYSNVIFLDSSSVVVVVERCAHPPTKQVVIFCFFRCCYNIFAFLSSNTASRVMYLLASISSSSSSGNDDDDVISILYPFRFASLGLAGS